MRSRGAFELSKVGGDLATIAHTCGVSVAAVSQWRAGLRTPSDVNRKLLHKQYAIDPKAWDQPMPQQARKQVPDVAPIAVTDLASAQAAIVAEAGRQLAILQAAVSSIASDPLASPQEVIRSSSDAAKALALLGKLTGTTLDISPKQMLASPAWRQIEAQIVAALEPWPDALEALAAALGGTPNEANADD